MRTRDRNSAINYLKRAFALIKDPAKRCVGAFARDASGMAQHAGKLEHAQFCSVGALEAVTSTDSSCFSQNSMPINLAYEALDLSALELGYQSAFHAHDKTHGEIVPKLYKTAVKLLEANKVQLSR